jgi:hypothetical protein
MLERETRYCFASSARLSPRARSLSAAERPAGIDILAKRDELDVVVVQLVENLEEVTDGPGEAIKGRDHRDIELTAVGVGQELIEAGPLRFHSADLVRVLMNDLEATLRGQASQIIKLRLPGAINLVEGRRGRIKRANRSPTSESAELSRSRGRQAASPGTSGHPPWLPTVTDRVRTYAKNGRLQMPTGAGRRPLLAVSIEDICGYMDVLLRPRLRRFFRPLKLRHLRPLSCPDLILQPLLHDPVSMG